MILTLPYLYEHMAYKQRNLQLNVLFFNYLSTWLNLLSFSSLVVQGSSLSTLYQVYMIKKRFTWNVNKSVTRVFSCSGPQNLSTRLMRVMLLHSMYWLSSPIPSFTSRRYSILNTVTDSFPNIFKFPYLNVVLLISTLSLFGSYLKQKERQL